MTTKRKLPNKSSDDNQEMEVEGGSKRKQITKKRRDINIEKANQLMKKSKNSNKEAAESADKEVIVVNEKRSNDDNDNDDEKEFKEIRKNRASTGRAEIRSLILYRYKS
ncbi:hypothetical protein GLOIN_2v1735910 [Rhizophagus irregularis DAOM 181602=DAOM 197198]|nr:hypothetical protein GLOIN_2v1735910 [Rhizophagus irregularis DAOM 181602=DAOM 197198]